MQYFKILFLNIIKLSKIIINSRELSRSAFILLIGLSLIIIYLIPDKFNSENDFIQISANLYSQTFVTYNKFGRGGEKHQYQVKLYGYNDTFIINDGFFDYFDKTNFEFFVKAQDTIFLDIAKKDQNELNTYSNIYIYGISSYSKCYLDFRRAIVDKDDKTEIYIGIVLIIIGLGMFYYYKGNFIT